MNPKANSLRPLFIVHLEDSLPDALLVETIITREWPQARIERVETYQEFTDALKRPGVDLVLADYSLPAFDGLAALDVARMINPDVPFIFLSGTIAENVAAEALNNGAVDYIFKDRMGRLCPAIHRVLEEGEERHVPRHIAKARSGFRLVHVEDSQNDAELIAKTIARDWPEVRIERVQTRESFVASLKEPDLDLILSDYSMPGFDGKSALALARTLRPKVPFIFLSGSIGEENAIEALKLGATDYILKDRPGRLRPAIRRALTEMEDGPLRAQPEMPFDEPEPIVERLQVLAAANRFLIWDWDLLTGSNWWSPGMVATMGYAEREIGTGPQALADYAHLDDVERVREGMRSALTESERWNDEFRFRHKDGHFVRVRADAAIVRDDAARPVRMVGALVAIDDEPGREPPVAATPQVKRIEKMLNTMAHILSNILTPILMGAGLLRLKGSEEESERLLDLMESSGKRGSKLVDSLLRSGIGRENTREVVHLEGLVGEAAESLRATLAPSTTLEVQLASDIGEVFGDREQLSRVIAVLSSNALDAMPNGGCLTLGVENFQVDAAMSSSLPGARAGAYVAVTLGDTGVGLPNEVRERLFDPFVTTKSLGEGTGLGLFIAKYIVRDHGGFISVTSEPHKGTTFRVFFPVDLQAARPV